MIRTTYDLLGYMSFFTVGEDECRAWSIARGTAAQAAAGEIHSDIQRGFIRAEVVAYDALTSRGSMAACRDHGEVRLEGKEYVVQDGDIINFRFATKRILVADAHVPFVTGGAELHVRSLIEVLRHRGHEVDLVALPFRSQPKEDLLAQAAAWRLLDLSSSNGQPVDLLIATRFPTYFARHPARWRG